MEKALLRSDKQYWETPQGLFDKLDLEFNFTLDPCAEPSTAKCKKYFTIEDNGLYQDWGGETCFVNPPYGPHIKKWVAKSCNEAMKLDTKIVMLIPSRTDTSYFHDIIIPYAKEIRFLRGRLKFLINGKEQGRAPFGSMIIVFDGSKPINTHTTFQLTPCHQYF